MTISISIDASRVNWTAKVRTGLQKSLGQASFMAAKDAKVPPCHLRCFHGGSIICNVFSPLTFGGFLRLNESVVYEEGYGPARDTQGQLDTKR